MTSTPPDLEAPPVDREPEPATPTGPSHVVGSLVRGVVLVVLVLIVAPAVIVDGDRLAVPVIALMVLAEIVIAVLAIVYWFATVGAPAPWLARRLRLTPDRFLIGACSVFVVGAVIALAWFRHGLRNVRSPLAQFDLRAASTAYRLAGERDLMQSLNRAGVRSMLLLGFMLVVAAVAVGAFRSAVLLASTIAITGILVEFLKISQPSLLTTFGPVDIVPTQWPSGHAAFQGSIALGMVLWWWGAGLPRPSLAAAVLVPLAVLVGYSRAFLGIHLLSEVLSGWLLAAAVAAFVVIVDRLVVPRLPAVHTPSRPWLAVVSVLVALVVTALSANYVHRIGDRGLHRFGGFGGFPGGLHHEPPGFDDVSTVPKSYRLTSSAPATVLASVPRFSETLLGEHDQPVSVVVVGNDQPLHAALAQGGWQLGAVSTPDDIAPTFWRALTGGSDRNKFAPAFLDTRSPTAVLRRPASDGRGTEVAQVWSLPLEAPNGCPVWAITAARDTGAKWTWPTLYPQHRIASDVDTAATRSPTPS